MRNCLNCNSSTTYIEPRGYPHWYKHGDDWYCNNCNNRLFKNSQPRLKTVFFKDKQILLDHNPRTGKCSKCGKEGKRTHIHHIKYHEDDPLKDTIELCISCHSYETWNRNRDIMRYSKYIALLSE